MEAIRNIFKGFHKDKILITANMAWPAIIESFFVAFAGLIDSLMVSSMGAKEVAAVGLTTQPKFMGLSLRLMFQSRHWWRGDEERTGRMTLTVF